MDNHPPRNHLKVTLTLVGLALAFFVATIVNHLPS